PRSAFTAASAGRTRNSGRTASMAASIRPAWRNLTARRTAGLIVGMALLAVGSMRRPPGAAAPARSLLQIHGHHHVQEVAPRLDQPRLVGRFEFEDDLRVHDHFQGVADERRVEAALDVLALVGADRHVDVGLALLRGAAGDLD